MYIVTFNGVSISCVGVGAINSKIWGFIALVFILTLQVIRWWSDLPFWRGQEKESFQIRDPNLPHLDEWESKSVQDSGWGWKRTVQGYGTHVSSILSSYPVFCLIRIGFWDIICCYGLLVLGSLVGT